MKGISLERTLLAVPATSRAVYKTTSGLGNLSIKDRRLGPNGVCCREVPTCEMSSGNSVAIF